eukprot:222323_1
MSNTFTLIELNTFIYGYMRMIAPHNNYIESNIIQLLSNYCDLLQFTNCFFVYGTLRDDTFKNRKQNGTNKTKLWSNGGECYLGIVYGYKMYGSGSYPHSIFTGDDNDFVIGRIIRFNDGKLFAKKLEIADSIEGFDPYIDEHRCHYLRTKTRCYMFDQLNDKKLKELNYYDSNVLIDFSKYSKTKQNAFIYYQTKAKTSKTTPNNDWTKRYILK